MITDYRIAFTALVDADKMLTQTNLTMRNEAAKLITSLADFNQTVNQYIQKQRRPAQILTALFYNPLFSQVLLYSDPFSFLYF